jgi:hypothetical protein
MAPHVLPRYLGGRRLEDWPGTEVEFEGLAPFQVRDNRTVRGFVVRAQTSKLDGHFYCWLTVSELNGFLVGGVNAESVTVIG